jgi:pyridoxal phosphate enzyme (YggS family)
MAPICDRLDTVRANIRAAERRFGRPPNSVGLLAVSKTHPTELIRAAHECGQRAFGENYAQELEGKALELSAEALEWHFIGPIQSNKTRIIAAHAHWVHTVDRIKIARRLSDQRPPELPPLQICLQANVSHESTKAGVATAELGELADAVADLPQLNLRGLMAIPAPQTDFEAQRRGFAELRRAYEVLIGDGHRLDTLSMGMTQDMEAAIAEGATLVRIGTAIFGPRDDSGRKTTL